MTRPSTHTRSAHHQRGSALLLVTITVAIVVTMGLTFLSSTATTTEIVGSHNDQQRARMIAESGLEYAIHYVNNSSSWRSSQTEGTWVSNQAYGGGTFSIIGQDGYDINGDGVVEGDGSLSDNSGDPVTLTSIGTFNGVSVSVSAAVMPGNSSTIATIEKVELKDHGVIDSYNSNTGPYGVDNRGEAAVVTCNDTGKPNIKFESGATIVGDFLLPNIDDLSLAFEKNDGTLTGSIRLLPVEQVEIPVVTPPTLGGSPSDVSYSDGETELSADLYCKKFEVKSDGILKITNNVSIVADGDVKIEGEIWLDNPDYGNMAESGTTQKFVDDIQIATPVLITENIQATSIAVYTSKSGKKLRLAIYSDNNGRPGSLLVETGQEEVTTNSAHWKEVSITPTDLEAGAYWVAVSFQDRDQSYLYEDTDGWDGDWGDWWDWWDRWDGWDGWGGWWYGFNWNPNTGVEPDLCEEYWQKYAAQTYNVCRGGGGGGHHGGGGGGGGSGGGGGHRHDHGGGWDGGWSGGWFGGWGGGWGGRDWGNHDNYEKTHYKYYNARSNGFLQTWGSSNDTKKPRGQHVHQRQRGRQGRFADDLRQWREV
jgi:hypothetical protein